MKRHALTLALLPLLAGCIDYSDGDRVGTVTKFSRKGFICKTWEGEMVLGGVRRKTSDDGSASLVSNVWAFTVEKPELIPIISKAMADGTPIRLTYRQEVTSFCRSDSGSYFVTAADVGAR